MTTFITDKKRIIEGVQPTDADANLKKQRERKICSKDHNNKALLN